MTVESKAHLRDDYKEFIVLSYTFLGEIPEGSVKIRAPGAFHQAKWIAAIYVRKIFLFREQFSLTAHEMYVVRNLSLFISLLHQVLASSNDRCICLKK